ncbi:MAG: hypothetical protein AB7G62_01980 [Magnetospirillum sp.]
MNAHWWSKSLAGIVCGFALALGLAGLLAWAGPGGVNAINKTQLVMWSIAPLWLTALSLVFLFPTGRQAWAWLGGANLVVWSAMLLTRAWAV